MAATASDREDVNLDPLIARPLPAPGGVEGSQRRRWELFAPTLAACMREALAASARSLFEEADRAPRGTDRHRLASTAAMELATRSSTIDARCTSALLGFFLDADGIAAHWQTSTGAFALSQGADRLLSGQTNALDALGRRLHGTKQGGPAVEARAMAAQLTGLLATALDTEDLPAHARNVLVVAWSRRMEDVLPGLAGLQAGEQAAVSPALAQRRIELADETLDRRVPTLILDALTRAQLEGLDDEKQANLSAQLRQRLTSVPTSISSDAVASALLEIDTEEQCLAALCGARETSALAVPYLQRLGPVLARIHLEHRPVHPAVSAWLETLIEATLDLSDAAHDARVQLIAELVSDALTHFSGPDTDVLDFVKTAYEKLEPCLRNQRERRNRSRDAALEARCLVQAREEADSICARLAKRTAIAPFVTSVWREVLMKGLIRHNADSAPRRRLQALGQALLTQPTSELRRERAALADALSLVLPDASAVEAELNALYEALELADDPRPPTQPALSDDTSGQKPEPPLGAGPWLLEDGRRCWILYEDSEVLLSDALGRDLNWRARHSFDEALAEGEIRKLSAETPLMLYARR